MLSVNLDKARHDLGTSAAGRTDYRVFTCLTGYMNGNGVSNVPQNLIAEETGYQRRTVSTSIHRLAEKGFLTIEKDTTGYRGIPSNIYHINPQYLMRTEDAKPANARTPQCSACVKPCADSQTNDVRRLARLGEVLTDVIHDLLAVYEKKETEQ